MPVKVFSAPGDHLDDFSQVERQYNDWEAEHRPRVTHLQASVTALSSARDSGKYMLTLVVLYEGK